MSILYDINACFTRETIEQGLAEASGHRSYRNALIPGWDLIENLKAVDQPRNGIWRTAHLDVRMFFDAHETRPLGMFENVGTFHDIEARLWRLLKIFPDPFDHRHILLPDGTVGKSSEAEQNKDIFAPLLRAGEGPERGSLIELIIGCSPRDIAKFCDQLLRSEPQLGEMVLAKRFREVKLLDPEIVERPLASRSSARNNYLPGFFACVLLAEMQRLAQNVCSQILFSFFHDGSEATIAKVVQACLKYQKKENTRSRSSELYKPCITQQMLHAPFQTRLHQSGLNSDPDLGLQQVYITSRELLGELMRRGEPLVNFITGLDPSSPSPGLANSMQAHTEWLPNRTAKQNSQARKPGNALRYWGMDWYDHAVLGLAQIHYAARRWNRQYCSDNPWPLQAPGSLWGLQKAIARIPYFWLETVADTAFEREATKLYCAKKRNSKGGKADPIINNADDLPVGDVRSLDEAKKKIATLPVFDDPSTKIKEPAVTAARRQAAETPPDGYPGYSAQYRPHLWLDRVNDDIGFWIGRQREICSSLCPFVDLKLSNLEARSAYRALLPDIKRYRNTPSSIFVKVAQNLAMTPSSFATDPIHIRKPGR